MREKLVKIFNNDVLNFMLTILPGYYSLTIAIIIIGYFGQNATKWAGPLILYSLAIVYFFIFVKNKYINPISKRGFIAFEVTMIVLKVIGAVLVVMNMPLYLSNLKYHSFSLLFPIDLFILFILYVVIDIILITGNKNREYKERVKHKGGFKFFAVLSRIFAILLCYSVYSYILGFRSLATLKTNYAFGFILIACMLILPLISALSSYLRFKTGKYITVQKISVSVSIVLVSVLMVYQMIDPSFMVNCAKMFLPLDFIGSIALGPIWLTFENLFPIVFLLAQNKKETNSKVDG